MLITHEREKLIEAIKYFAGHTKHCGLTKLFKLLFFLDFDHFRETGRSVTGLNYEAWSMGPVPADLYSEIKGAPRADMNAHLRIEDHKEIERDIEVKGIDDSLNTFGSEAPRTITRKARVPANIWTLKQFNSKFFSKRELRLLEQIAFIYKELTAEQISEVSHLKGKPWHVTKTKHGLKAPIDYMLALNEQREGAPSKEEILSRIEERQAVLQAFK